MRDLAPDLAAWERAGLRYAVATVIAVTGSAPRAPGTSMAVAENGEVLGSVSGGCVEGAVYELCRDVIVSGTAVRETFGYSDDTAFAVGLTCGGTIEVFVRTQPPADVLEAVATGSASALVQVLEDSGAVLVVEHDGHRGTTGSSDLDAVLAAEARAMSHGGASGLRSVRSRPGLEVFIASYAPPPRLLVFGATDYAGAVASVGRFLGYRVTVCDARPVFTTSARFPDADEVVVDWPHRYLAATGTDARTIVVVLTHDAKFDVPLLEVALRLPLAYVGAMGSRRTHDERRARLRTAGLTDHEMGRLRSPVGLDLGARTPEETAVAIAAEFIAARRGGTTRPLSRTDGPIHHDETSPHPLSRRAGVP